MLPRIVRSPVEICFGTTPSQAPKSRPLENTSPVPMADLGHRPLHGRDLFAAANTGRSVEDCRDWVELGVSELLNRLGQVCLLAKLYIGRCHRRRTTASETAAKRCRPHPGLPKELVSQGSA